MKLVNNKHGAVSVFLAIVLVPCIVFSCIFVDLARVKMSKATAESSADLALNTLLTNYDADLNEYFGLIASCQDIQKFYTVSAEYFLRTISSQGLSDEEISTLAGMYAEITDDRTIIDLMAVEPQGEQPATIQEVPKANLGNPVFLKDSIVEFMKYRGPIEIARNLIERINTSGDDVKYFTESKENDALTTAKRDFYKAEGELLEAAIQTYLAIQDYEAAVKSKGKTVYNAERLKSDQAKIVAYRDVYAQIHEISVNYLLNTGSLTKAYVPVTYNIDEYSNFKIKDYKSVYSSKEKKEDGTTVYYINGKDFDTLVNTADRSLRELKQAVNEYVNATSELMKNAPTSSNGINAVQWWNDMHKAVYSHPTYGNVHNKVKEKGKAVMNAYGKLLAVYNECEKEPVPKVKPAGYKELPNDWKTTCKSTYESLKSAHYTYLSFAIYLSNNNQAYCKAVSKLAYVSEENLHKVSAANHYVKVDGQNMSVENALVYISAQLTGMYKEYDKIIKLLDICIDGKGEVKSLDTLKTLAKTYSSNFTTYENNVKPQKTQMQKDEKEHLKEVALKKEINDKSVSELKTRLTNIRNQFKTMRDEAKALTYGGTAVKDIASFSTFKSKALTKVKDSEISINQNSINYYSDETLAKLLKPATADELKKLKNTGDVNYNPDLDQSTPELYKYMKEEFKDLSQDELAEKEQDEKDQKDAQDKFQEEEKSKATAYRGPAETMAEYTTNAASVTDALGSMVGLIKDLMNQNFDGIRDDMYVTTYIMEMFTYASYDREEMYRMLDADQRKNMVPSGADAYFKTCGVYGDASADTNKQRGKWVSTDLQDTYNKSLTNKLFCDANNKIRTAEVEYVLYGNSDPAENLKSAYGNIYTIRFTLNTISAFQHFWGGGTVTGAVVQNLAVTLSGLTGGIVPPPVFQAVILPILAAVESCKDNSRLFAGMPVELYKADPNDWWISFERGDSATRLTGFFNMIKGQGDENKNQDKGFFYSDYLTLFVYCALSNSDTEQATYERLERLIEGNMGKITGKTYSLSKARTYFQLTSKLRVKPLMVTLPYYFDEYNNTMKSGTDWCTYDVSMVRGYS